MRSLKLLALAPLGLVLAGCMTYGGDVYGSYNQPGYTYSYPAYGYGHPSTRYYSQGAPAVVAPSGSYYYGQSYPAYPTYPNYGGSRYDSDGDRVADHMDRYPYDARRW